MGYLIFKILLHVLVGWAYFELAEKHGRHKWLFAFIGIGSYYIAKSMMTLGAFVFLYREILATGESAQLGAWILALNFMVGMFTCFGLFQILDHRWTNNPKLKTYSVEMLDSEILS